VRIAIHVPFWQSDSCRYAAVSHVCWHIIAYHAARSTLEAAFCLAFAAGVAAADTYCCGVSGRHWFAIRAYLMAVFYSSNCSRQRHGRQELRHVAFVMKATAAYITATLGCLHQAHDFPLFASLAYITTHQPQPRYVTQISMPYIHVLVSAANQGRRRQPPGPQRGLQVLCPASARDHCRHSQQARRHRPAPNRLLQEQRHATKLRYL
jgi:hypothetical protein